MSKLNTERLILMQGHSSSKLSLFISSGFLFFSNCAKPREKRIYVERERESKNKEWFSTLCLCVGWSVYFPNYHTLLIGVIEIALFWFHSISDLSVTSSFFFHFDSFVLGYFDQCVCECVSARRCTQYFPLLNQWILHFYFRELIAVRGGYIFLNWFARFFFNLKHSHFLNDTDLRLQSFFFICQHESICWIFFFCFLNNRYDPYKCFCADTRKKVDCVRVKL
jgi:hypothetical protein